MLVFGPGKYRERFPEYLGILLRGHFALMLPGAALLAAAAFLLGWVYSPAVERAFLALAIAAPFILLLWLLRRAFYVRLNPGWAAAGGVVYLLILLASALALRAAGRLTPATGFLAMAGGKPHRLPASSRSAPAHVGYGLIRHPRRRRRPLALWQMGRRWRRPRLGHGQYLLPRAARLGRPR